MALPFYDIGSKSLARLRDVSQGITLRKQEKLREKGQRLAEARFKAQAEESKKMLELRVAQDERQAEIHESSMTELNNNLEEQRTDKAAREALDNFSSQYAGGGLTQGERWDKVQGEISNIEDKSIRAKAYQGLRLRKQEAWKATGQLMNNFNICIQAFGKDDAGKARCHTEYRLGERANGRKNDDLTFSYDSTTNIMTEVMTMKDVVNNQEVYNLNDVDRGVRKLWMDEKGITEAERAARGMRLVQVTRTPVITIDSKGNKTQTFRTTISPISALKIAELVTHQNPDVREIAKEAVRQAYTGSPQFMENRLKEVDRKNEFLIRSIISGTAAIGSLLKPDRRMRGTAVRTVAGEIDRKALAQQLSSLPKNHQDDLREFLAEGIKRGSRGDFDPSMTAQFSRAFENGDVKFNATVEDLRGVVKMLSQEFQANNLLRNHYLNELGVEDELLNATKILMADTIRSVTGAEVGSADPKSLKEIEDLKKRLAAAEKTIKDKGLGNTAEEKANWIRQSYLWFEAASERVGREGWGNIIFKGLTARQVPVGTPAPEQLQKWKDWLFNRAEYKDLGSYGQSNVPGYNKYGLPEPLKLSDPFAPAPSKMPFVPAGRTPYNIAKE